MISLEPRIDNKNITWIQIFIKNLMSYNVAES